jgi:hypothetical protein
LHLSIYEKYKECIHLPHTLLETHSFFVFNKGRYVHKGCTSLSSFWILMTFIYIIHICSCFFHYTWNTVELLQFLKSELNHLFWFHGPCQTFKSHEIFPSHEFNRAKWTKMCYFYMNFTKFHWDRRHLLFIRLQTRRHPSSNASLTPFHKRYVRGLFYKIALYVSDIVEKINTTYVLRCCNVASVWAA